MCSLLISMCIAGCFGSFISAFLLQLTASRHHLRPPPVSINSITGTTTYSSSNSISLPRAQTPPNTRRQPPMAPWAIPFACTNSIRLTPTRHRLRHHHHLTHRRQTPLLPSHRRHRHHSLRPHQQHQNRSPSSTVPLTRLHRHLLLQFHLQLQPSDASGSQACRLLRCSLGYLRTMGRRTLQPGRSVTASFAGSFLPGVSPSQFLPPSGDSR